MKSRVFALLSVLVPACLLLGCPAAAPRSPGTDASVDGGGAKSDNADLSSLTVSVGGLSPSFAPGTASYALSVEAAVASIVVTGTAADAKATISANNGLAQGLALGPNLISLRVTAENGTTVKDYAVTVTRRDYRAAVAGDVVISEIAWAGTAYASSAEWVELYNNSDDTVDLNGWRLTESNTGTAGSTLLSGSLPARSFFLIIGNSGAAFQGIAGNQNLSSFSNDLRNGGELLGLAKSDGTLIDSANQPRAGSVDMGWYAGSNLLPKHSMERNAPAAGAFPDGALDASWHDNDGVTWNGFDLGGSPVGGTPGKANSGW